MNVNLPMTSRRLVDDTAKNLVDDLIQNGGSSLTLTGEKPAGGFMVSLPDSELRVRGYPSSALVAQWIRDNGVRLFGPDRYLGAWFDEKTGHTYLDVSLNIQDLTEAVNTARQAQQLALYDVANGRSIDLN